MSAFLWTGGHLGNAFFGIIAFSVAGFLITDFAWRMVAMRAWLLSVIVLTFWFTGIVVILWLAS